MENEKNNFYDSSINQLHKTKRATDRERFLRLLLRQGNHCNICGAHNVEIVIDHIDNNPENNRHSQLKIFKGLLCK